MEEKNFCFYLFAVILVCFCHYLTRCLFGIFEAIWLILMCNLSFLVHLDLATLV